jgi:hypothetical protein
MILSRLQVTGCHRHCNGWSEIPTVMYNHWQSRCVPHTCLVKNAVCSRQGSVANWQQHQQHQQACHTRSKTVNQPSNENLVPPQ